MPLTALGMPFQPVPQSYILQNISKLTLCMASHLHCGDSHGFSTQDTADYLRGCLPRDVTHRQVLWQSRRVPQALAASALQRSLRGGVSLRPSLAACRNEGQRNFVPSGSRASDTVMCSLKGTFLSWLLCLGRRRTTSTGMRNVSCSCHRTSASDIRQPKCWPEGTSIHLPGKDAGIFTHWSSSKERWRQTATRKSSTISRTSILSGAQACWNTSCQ